MTDQTPTDDAVRRAHEWCDLHWPTDENRTPMADVIRHYRATVPAPPKTLADELRDWAGSTPEEGAHWDEWDDFSGLADRVEAVEKENERLSRDREAQEKALVQHGRLLSEARTEREEARAEVERLKAELDTRRVIDRPEDLDKLPVRSVVLDRYRAWEKHPDDEWYSTELDDGFSSRQLMNYNDPMTVIHTPKEES